MKKKRYLTLIEMMIVIMLIGIITSVIGYNMKGSLNKGKAFKTEQAMIQIKDLLLLEAAEKEIPIDEIVKDPRKHLQNSSLAKDVDGLLKDGWGANFEIRSKDRGRDIEIISQNLNRYNSKKNKSSSSIKEEDEY